MAEQEKKDIGGFNYTFVPEPKTKGPIGRADLQDSPPHISKPSLKPRYILLAGAAIMIVGSFVPWWSQLEWREPQLQIGWVTQNATSSLSNFMIILAPALCIMVVCLLGKDKPKRRVSIIGASIAIISGICSALLLLWGLTRESPKRFLEYGPLIDWFHLHSGLYIYLIGAIVAIIGGLKRNSQ